LRLRRSKLETGCVLCYYVKVRIFKNAWFSRFARKELVKLKKQACLLFSMSNVQIEAALKEGVLVEV
jgi:hypothetical protein